MVVQGSRTKKKKAGPFRRIFTHTFQNNELPRHKSLCGSRSDIHVFLAVKVHVGRGLLKISGAQKTVIFATKKVGVCMTGLLSAFRS